MNVLVVEDEARIAAFLVKGFARRGYHVEHTASGGDALRRVCAGADYDLLLLDLGLPDIDGLDVLRLLRTRGFTVPIIVLTARAPDRDEGLRRGADDYLIKPFSFAELLARIDARLRVAASSDSPSHGHDGRSA
jgi:DNA-binding response OmpR family regulator